MFNRIGLKCVLVLAWTRGIALVISDGVVGFDVDVDVGVVGSSEAHLDAIFSHR